LDSLSSATDDSDNHPTVSKFPKTRPLELNSKQGENGQEIALVANYVKILAAPKCKFCYNDLFPDYYFYVLRGFIPISLYIRSRCN
jgi:hypothetical protein